MKYEILVNILDKIRAEPQEKHLAKYQPPLNEPEKINNARSRAFVHLYLKVLFGLQEFEEREWHVTDGSYDGGIDGYFIDQSTKTVYLIQAKFRPKVANFEGKDISLEEVLRMDINRILEGEQSDENGNAYNGKIKQLQREISDLSDIARYTYKVVLLANLQDVSPTKLRQLTGGYAVDVFDFEKSYAKLVFPVISGTYFTASEISIPIDLSNKNAGSKISYTVKTRISDCEITVLFAPTIEIAKIMNTYKNAILKYNPRSFLDLQGQSVNGAIRETILQTSTNEFALYNNGITILSDETYINEKIGQKNKAQLIIKNPQIINGGQTSYTLSRIYEENKGGDVESIFQAKEVLIKIITLIEDKSHQDKLRLIEDISNATNKQTPVLNADRFANEAVHLDIQKKVFERYGLLYERKRGEFADGLKSGYIDPKIIIERNHFLRLYYCANGRLNKGVEKKLFQKNQLADLNLNNDEAFDKFYLASLVFPILLQGRNPSNRIERDTYAKLVLYVRMYFGYGLAVSDAEIRNNLLVVEDEWSRFVEERHRNSKVGRKQYVDRETGEVSIAFKLNAYLRSGILEEDLANHKLSAELH
jgi:hypothetical protein